MGTSDNTSYFVRFRGRVSGPFTLERLRGMAYAGQLSPIHELSTDRSAWAPASEVPGLLPSAPTSEPAPQPVAHTQPNPPDERWYYMDAAGNRTGPMSRGELVGLVRQGQLDEDTAVWSKGMADWVPFHEAGLAPAVRRSPTWVDQPATAVPDRAPGVGYGITAMVLGILSLLTSCLGFVPYAGLVFMGIQLVLGVMAVCFGAAGMRTQGRGMAITGLVTGIISVALFLLVVVLVLVFLGSLAALMHGR